jgi:hypothetical protein
MNPDRRPTGRVGYSEVNGLFMANGVGVSASFRSPTWAVDLTARRVSPVLHLPLGLAGVCTSPPAGCYAKLPAGCGFLPPPPPMVSGS